MGNFSYVPGKNKVKDIFSQSQQKSVVTEEAVLSQGLGALERGTALILRTSGGTKYWDSLRKGGADIKNNAVPSPDDRIDGILAYDIDATLDDVKTVVYLTGCFISECVDLGEADLASVAGNARKNGLYFEGFAPDGGGPEPEPEPAFFTLKASGTMFFDWVPADVNSLSIDWGQGFESVDVATGWVSKVLTEPTVIRVDIEGDLPQICPDLRKVTEIHDFGSQIVGYVALDPRYMDNSGVTRWPEYLPPQMTNCTGLCRYADLSAAPEWDYSGVVNGTEMFYGTALAAWGAPLPALVTGTSMFENTPLTEWDAALPALVTGTGMFEGTDLAAWDTALPALVTGTGMFYGTDLAAWDTALPALVTGTSMFENTPLTEWDAALPALVTGTGMFEGTDLAAWDTALPALVTGTGMFYGTDLAAWDAALPALVTGTGMFEGTDLAAWDTALPALVTGTGMFENTPLTEWDAALPALVTGTGMFRGTDLAAWDAPLPALVTGTSMFEGTSSLKSFLTDGQPPLDLQSAEDMFYGSSMENADLGDWYCPTIANKPDGFDEGCHENFANQANKQPNWGVPYP